MMIDLNVALSFVAGVTLCTLILAVVRKINNWVKTVKDELSAISLLAAKLDMAVISINASADEMFKVATDNNLAAESIAKSAVQLNLLLEDIKAIMMPEPPSQQAGVPVSLMTMQSSFERIEKDLLQQGVDPETAKYKAAEYELDRLAEGDLSEVSMSL